MLILLFLLNLKMDFYNHQQHIVLISFFLIIFIQKLIIINLIIITFLTINLFIKFIEIVIIINFHFYPIVCFNYLTITIIIITRYVNFIFLFQKPSFYRILLFGLLV